MLYETQRDAHSNAPANSAETVDKPAPEAAGPGPKRLHDQLTEFDRSYRAQLVRRGMPVGSLALPAALADWAMHLACAPGQQVRMALDFIRTPAEAMRRAAARANGAAPVADNRFAGEAWELPPFNLLAESFLVAEEFSRSLFRDVPGLSRRNQRLLDFFNRQVTNAWTPTNFLATNPEAQKKTRDELGFNLLRGTAHLLADFAGDTGDEMDGFEVGVDLATAEGGVVFRNELMELIQYKPQTTDVLAEPILIVPAWIMKYYILDLSKHNSMVRYLTSRGHTVFVVSWKNPGPEDRCVGFEDYLRSGVLTALDKVAEATGGADVHLAGYCLGGTMAAIAAAWLGRRGNSRLASLTLLAAQVDFEDAGELTLFIDESQLSFIEDLMWDQGYLDSAQMSGSFQALRPDALIWGRLYRDYLLGEEDKRIDLMAWNADGTRLPFKMHSEYLRSCYLNNDLAEGRFEVGGEKISVSDIRAPVFAVGTTDDHIAPWQSVYKIRILSDTDVTFVLAKGGHNGGIVSAPGRPGKSYRIAASDKDDHYQSPEDWLRCAPQSQGSWWEAWTAWLEERSTGRVAPRVIKSLGTAPGHQTPDEASGKITPAPGLYVRRAYDNDVGRGWTQE